MCPAGPPGGDQLNHAAAEIAVGQRNQTAFPQFGIDKKIRHVAPAKALQDRAV